MVPSFLGFLIVALEVTGTKEAPFVGPAIRTATAAKTQRVAIIQSENLTAAVSTAARYGIRSDQAVVLL